MLTDEPLKRKIFKALGGIEDLLEQRTKLEKAKAAEAKKPKAKPIPAPKPHFAPKPQARVIRKHVARGR